MGNESLAGVKYCSLVPAQLLCQDLWPGPTSLCAGAEKAGSQIAWGWFLPGRGESQSAGHIRAGEPMEW